jgi:transglutaminase-like putative cysteine protease
VLIEHPHFAGPIEMTRHVLSDLPDEQVAQTIAVMREFALQDAGSVEVTEACIDALNRFDAVPPVAAWAWVKQRLTFVPDEVTAQFLPRSEWPVIEVVVRPKDILRSVGAGDCDDYSCLLASMLVTMGIPCSFVTVAADDEVPGQYSHVYVAAYFGGRLVDLPRLGRIALDSSHGHIPGWETPNKFGKRTEWVVGE